MKNTKQCSGTLSTFQNKGYREGTTTEPNPGELVKKYEEIAEKYRQQIASGELSPGDKLPTVREVRDAWKVSLSTADRAMSELRRVGLVTAKPRVGTVVAEPKRTIMTGAARLDRLIRTGSTWADGEISEPLRKPAMRSCYDPYVAEQLGIEMGDEMVLRIRRFRQGERVTAIGLSFIHVRALQLVPELLEEAPLPKFWQLLYAERGGGDVEPARYEYYRSRFAAKDEIAAFGVEPPEGADMPVMFSNLTFHTADGRPIEVWEDVYPPWSAKAVARPDR